MKPWKIGLSSDSSDPFAPLALCLATPGALKREVMFRVRDLLRSPGTLRETSCRTARFHVARL